MAARLEERNDVCVLQGLVWGGCRLPGLHLPGTGSFTVVDLLALGSDGAGAWAAAIIIS